MLYIMQKYVTFKSGMRLLGKIWSFISLPHGSTQRQNVWDLLDTWRNVALTCFYTETGVLVCYEEPIMALAPCDILSINRTNGTSHLPFNEIFGSGILCTEHDTKLIKDDIHLTSHGKHFHCLHLKWVVFNQGIWCTQSTMKTNPHSYKLVSFIPMTTCNASEHSWTIKKSTVVIHGNA